MGQLINEIVNISKAVEELRQRVDLLLAAYGEGSISAEEIQKQIEEATQGAIDKVLSELSGLDVSVLETRMDLYDKLRELRDSVSSEKFWFELAKTPYSMIDNFSVSVISAVAGDDSIDVESTAGLVPGQTYIISDGEHSEEIIVSEILTETRFRATKELENTYESGTIKRSTAFFDETHQKIKGPGIYVSKRIEFSAGARIHVFFSGGLPVIKASQANPESFSLLATKYNEGEAVAFVPAGSYVFRIECPEDCEITAIVWVEGRLIGYTETVEVLNSDGTYDYRFAEKGLPIPSQKEYQVLLTPEGPYIATIKNKSEAGFTIQLYKLDGTPGAEVTGEIYVYPGMEGLYPSAGFYPGQIISGDMHGPKVNVAISF